jgi:hypothetical protein
MDVQVVHRAVGEHRIRFPAFGLGDMVLHQPV